MTNTHKIKYPRTMHLPWSLGVSDDDKIIKSISQFENRRVIVTEKMDGENSTLYRDATHARSLDSRHHFSRNWLKQFWGEIRYDIPVGYRVCGENLYSTHSISYQNLPSYFLGFSIWTPENECMSWDDTLEWFDLIGIEPVAVLFDGVWDETVIKRIKVNSSTSEGYVVRLADSFTYDEFNVSVGKYVRAGHVQTDTHWMSRTDTPTNKLTTP